MKINVNELQGAALDRTVAKCKGIEVVAMKEGRATFSDPTDDGALNEMPINYSTDWSQGGPIIEQNKIDVMWSGDRWCAYTMTPDGQSQLITEGDTPLIAAMRGFVASRMGDEVNVPDDLVWDDLIYEKGDQE